MPPDDTTPPPPPADPPGTVFDAGYVKGLRDEAAKYRIAGKEARDALAHVAEMLGVAPEHQADPARVRHAASSLRLAADLEAGIARHALDRRLTLAVIAQERALAGVEPGQADTASQIDEVLTRLANATPALRATAPAGPARSGLPISGSGTGQQTPISRAELAALPPERVETLRKAGLLAHLLRGE